MSTDDTQLTETDRLVKDHMPQALWMTEGAFRFDQHLLAMLMFVAENYPARSVTRALGAPPCAWSLDLYANRQPMSIDSCASVIRAYAQYNMGLVLNFDNPSIPATDLEDAMGLRLVQLLMENNSTGRNAVCVASDALAATLRRHFPALPLICHQNRLIMATEKRTPALYEKLGETYREIILHPRDAVNSAFFSQLRSPWKYIAVLNDPIPRTYAARRELLHILAEQRLHPWDLSIAEAKENLAHRTGIFEVKNSCNLTRSEEAALYGTGVRSFLVQSFMHRNELTLFWDLFYHLFRTRPEYENDVALLISAAMAHIRDSVDDLPSGLKLFNFADS